MNIIDYLDSNNISVGTEHFKKENVIIVNGNLAPEQVEEEVWNKVQHFFE